MHDVIERLFTNFRLVPSLLTLVPVLAFSVRAQEMEPRAYSRAPVGTQFVLFTYSYQSGDVLTDSTSPIDDVSVNLNAGLFGYGRTFALAGRQANASILLSYVKGKARGTVFENELEVTRSGMSDIRLRFSTNLAGGPALSPKEFAAYKPRTTVGTSVTIVIPTGQYDPARLVNLGSNRWSFKPEIGISKPVGRWTMEVAGGVWLFTANKNYFGGVRREQKPLASFQGSVIYTLRPRMWLSGSATFFAGGQTKINGVEKADRQSNTRVGSTFSFPVTRQQSIKAAVSHGLTSRFGGKLTGVAIGWQYIWF